MPLATVSVQAVDFGEGDLNGRLATTISQGLTFGTGRGDGEANDALNNYDRGLMSSTSKITTDLELNYQNLGMFVRATGFRDPEVQSGDEEDLEVLDAYVYGTFEIGRAPASLRLGDHVINWGESTFIPYGINVTNPFDLDKIARPGSELREASIPVSMASATVSPIPNLSIESYYQFDWEPAQIGARSGISFVQEPRNGGQWGAAFRYYAEELDSAELGLYYIEHHARIPVISARQGDRRSLAATLQKLQPFLSRPPGRPPLPPAAATAALLQNPRVQGLLREYVSNGTLYPEDLKLIGASINSELGTSGWAIQGEYTFRPDAPVQRSLSEVFTEAAGPLVRAALLPAACGNIPPPRCITRAQFLRSYQPGFLPGYIERDISQVQATLTKSFGPTLGADSALLVAELGLTHVHGMPTDSESVLRSSNADPESRATATSWGYRVSAELEFNNPIAAVNLFPFAQVGHGVSGNTPLPTATFVEDSITLTLGTRLEYLQRWEASLDYTIQTGRSNRSRNRDFVAASVKYSF